MRIHWVAGVCFALCASRHDALGQDPARLPTVRVNAAPPPPGARRIAGVVRDTSGFPVAGVEVSIAGKRRALSRGDGSFGFEDLGPGTYEVRARKLGYAPQIRSIVVDTAGGAGAFALLPIPYSLLPVVSSAAGGGLSGVVGDTAFHALPGAEIRLAGHNASTTADSTGAFFIPVRPGSYIVTVTRAGFASKVVSVIVPPDSGRRISVYLPPLKGQVPVRAAHNVEDFSKRLVARSIMNSRVITRAELEARGIEWVRDAVQMAYMSLTPGPQGYLDPDCWAVKNGGPDAVEIGPLTVDEIETIELYFTAPTRTRGGIGAATVRSLRRSFPQPVMSNTGEAAWANRTKTCATVYVWMR